ncbi:MAG: trigger factor [bacterium]|nr:trigger factor [bacterium]
MSVVTSFEETGPCRKKLTIEVPVEAVEAEMGRVIGNYRKSVRIPGFRRGKVPASVIQKRFHEEIKQEVVDRLLPRYWHQAQAEKNLDPLLPPSFDDLELEPGQPLTVTASVETRPEIELGELGDFELPEGETEPIDEEIEEALRDLRRQHATWSPVERPAAQGDLVVGAILDPETEGDAPDRQPIQIELGADGVDEELSLALTGRSAGQTAAWRRHADSDEEREVDVEIEAVKEQELPDLDEDFVSRLGLETVEALREAVENNLRGGKERDLKMRRERAMLEQLRQRHPLDLPTGVVEKESERMLQEYAERLHSQGVDIENAGIDWESLTGQLKPEAERRVHERLVLDAVSAGENLRLDESEFERFLSVIAAQQKMTSLALRQQLSESGRLEPLRAQMLRERTVQFLLGEDKPEAESEDGEPSSETPDET